MAMLTRFEKIFCGGADLSSLAAAAEEAGEGGAISEGGGIWPHVTALNMCAFRSLLAPPSAPCPLPSAPALPTPRMLDTLSTCTCTCDTRAIHV